ncbi:MAG TPA: O-antigen ligase family protein [Bryobacteraceae bacterium]|nr:O-antigen ligase family protein [Bryobacteraceae bacterium]
MRFIVPLVAALVPLLITPGLLSHFDITPKAAVLLFALPLILLYRSANLHNFHALLRGRGGRWFAGLLAVQWGSATLATAFSLHPWLSLHGSTWRRYGLASETALLLFVLLVAAWLAADSHNIRRLLRAATAAGALASLYGIAQYFGWDPWQPVQAYQAGEGLYTIVRPPGTLGHADYFGAWLVVVTFLAAALARLEPPGWRKYAASASAGLALAAIILSGTRSALLGVLAGALVYAVSRRSRMRMRTLAAMGVGALALVIFFVSPPGAKLRARLHWSIEDARGGGRLLLWRDSLRMSARRPLTGFGPETFATEFPRFESLDLARAYPDFYQESPHNLFLDALTAEGWLGLLALGAVCALGGWTMLRGLRSGHTLAAPFAAALVGLLVAQQFIVLVLATALYFYLLIALLIACEPVESRDPAVGRVSSWLAPSLALALSLALLVFAVRLVAADAALAVVQRRIAAGDANGAARAYQAVLQWEPPGAGADLDYSRAMQRLATSSPIVTTRLTAEQQAIQSAIRATTTTENRQDAWYNLAGLLARANDTAAVERCLRNASAWAPNWFKPHWMLAQVLSLSGRHAEALAEASQALEQDGGHHPEVLETWNKLQQSGH